MYNKPTSEAGLLNKSLCLAQALGVTKFINMRDMIWSYFVVLLKSHLDIQQTHLRWLIDAYSQNVFKMIFFHNSFHNITFIENWDSGNILKKNHLKHLLSKS